MTRPDKQQLLASHRLRWSTLGVWVGFAMVFFSLQAFTGYCVFQGWWWTAGLLVLVLAHLMHAHLLALHEAAHSTLCPNYYLNEAVGIFVGTLGLIEFSLFRAVHHLHHAYMATPRDEEMWPFVNVEVPRWQRRLAAFGELTCGLFYTPLLLLRCFLRRGSPIANPKVRRRIWAELAGMVVTWTVILGTVAYFGVWLYFFVLYFCPAYLAGNMQSLRKYVEHMGLTGARILECTRTIVPRTMLARFVVWTLFDEPYHGVHHTLPRLPHFTLPEYSAILEPPTGAEIPPFPNYRTALWDMLASLPDPRIGPQWVKERPRLGRRVASATAS